MRAEHMYVHVPFCARRCVYCDFSIAVRAEVPDEEYLAAVERELELRHRSSKFDLDTLYLGGGTPSRLAPASVQRLVDLVGARASLRADAEVTLEANPEDVTTSGARAWMAAGITRVSLGVQSFQPNVLAWMHRTHSAEQGTRAIGILRDAGITNLSVDLIFAVPAALERSWHDDLARALELRVPHVSVYGLTVEPHTALGRWVARDDAREATEESFETEFLEGSRTLSAAGYHHYEVSNYALPGRESRHNSAYWQRRPYAGLGPSAHEFDGTTRRWNVAPYASWVRHLSAGEDPIGGRESLTPDQVRAEAVYLGLRTTHGLQLSDDESDRVGRWVDSGWARITPGGRVQLTPVGWLRLDALSADLTHVRSRY